MAERSNLPNITSCSQFRATETWQKLVEHFRCSMPLKSHRYQLWFKENCFTGCEAVDWMYNEGSAGKLQNLFNKEITRQQIITLLQKFYEAEIFKAVNPNLNRFKDRSDLTHRFIVPKNSMKSISKGSVLSSLNLFLMNKPQSLSPQPIKRDKVMSNHRMKSYSMENVAMNTYLSENNKIANYVINNLSMILKSFNMDDFLNIENINKQWIILNIYNPQKNEEGLFPHWVKTAMDSLVNDLDKEDCAYPGFKADVYSVIKDYFLNSEEPIIPITFYELFISILVIVERHDHICGKKSKSSENCNLKYNSSTTSTTESEYLRNLSKSEKSFDNSIYYNLMSMSISSCSSASFYESCEVEQSNMEHKPLNNIQKLSKPKLYRTTSSPEISSKTRSYYDRIKKRRLGRTTSNNSVSTKKNSELDKGVFSDNYGFANESVDLNKRILTSSSGYVNFALFQSEEINHDNINGINLDMAVSSIQNLVDNSIIDSKINSTYKLFNGLNDKSIHLGIVLYRLLCLCLPPLNRAKLQLFLKFISNLSTKYSKVSEKLCSTVLRQNVDQFDYDCLASDVVMFLIHNHETIFLPINTNKILSEKFNFRNSEDENFYSDNLMHYCQRISDQEFEQHRSKESKDALIELLDQIINCSTMTTKEKNKRLKMFQKLYPDVYEMRFILQDDKKKNLIHSIQSRNFIKNLRI
ncbi:DEP domain-containing protein 1B-like [Daktulosphaira vitifoliae]|uniref:DEP domain-containing protein 1B-like n=1 Tax=Daktulosphaira vitifoliae TaxID=58002 RepID=UPI0021A9DF70|nr:DEP domain-containing protein 1B-like [Daktulosphaira vitifoliae]